MSWKTRAEPVKPNWKYRAIPADAPEETMWDRISGGRELLSKKLDASAASKPPAAPMTDTNEGQAGIEHMANSALFGYLPQVTAAAQKPIYGLLNAATGQDVEADPYVDVRDASVDRLARQSKESPWASGLGDLAGAVANTVVLPVPMPGKFLNNTTATAGKGLMGLGRRAAQGAVMGAEYGAVSNPGDVKGEVSPLQLGERVDKTLDGARSGALISGGLNLGAKAIESAPKVGKALLSTAFGPSVKDIDRYLENPEAINNAKSIPELKSKVDEIVGDLRGQVDRGEITVREAKENLKEAQRMIADNRKESGFQYQVTKSEINNAWRDAKSEFDKAYQGKIEALKGIKAPLHLADDVDVASRELKDKVVKGSQEAVESLDANVNIQPAFRSLADARDGLNIGVHGPVTPQAKAAAAELDKLINDFGQLSVSMAPQDAKKLIQQLDRSEKAIYDQGAFSDEVGQAYKTLRAEVDKSLKAQNPAYAEKMKPVAENTRLYGAVREKFGDRSSTLSTLNKVGADTAEVERQTLANLGKATGRDFEKPVQDFRNAQGILKDPKALRNIERGLPERRGMVASERAKRMLDGPAAQREFIEGNLKGSGLLEKESAAAGLLGKEEQGLLSAREKAEPLSKLGPGNSEPQLKQLFHAKPGENVEARKAFEQLSRLSDTDFVKAVENLKTKQAFSGSRPNGSRNVNLFGALGAGVGMFTGGIMHAGELGAVGAVFGGMVDKFGPAMSKKVLDGVIKMGRNPTIQQIKNMNVPEPVKQDLQRMLIEFNREQKR